MQCDLGMIDKTLEKLMDKIDIKITDSCTRVFSMILQSGPSRKIYNHP